jgi:CheY-like chemotaxis protein
MEYAKRYFAGDEFCGVETAEQAIKMLEENSPYDLVSLDHDLGGEYFAPSDEVSGYAVAEHISKMPKDKLPKKVVIHSFNSNGAKNMENVLKGIVPVSKDETVPLQSLRQLYGKEMILH